jgi:hypothetical protein
MLLGYLLGALVCRLWLLRHEKGLWREFIKYPCYLLGVAVMSFVVVLPFWPYAQPNPLGTLLSTLTQIAHFPWNGAVLFNGQIYAATDLPWYYLPEMLIITTPEFFLLLSGLGLVMALSRMVPGMLKSGLGWFKTQRIKQAFVLACLIAPIAIICIRSATLYDGIRHFLFTLPIWAVLLAIAFEYLTRTPVAKSLTPMVCRPTKASGSPLPHAPCGWACGRWCALIPL